MGNHSPISSIKVQPVSMKSALIILALAATVLAHPQVRPIQQDERRTCVHVRFLREHVCFQCRTPADAAAFAMGSYQANGGNIRQFDNYDIFGGRRNPNVVEDAAYIDQWNGQALCRIDGQTAWRCNPVVGSGGGIRNFNCRTCQNSPNVSSWSTQINGHWSYTSEDCRL